MDGTSAEPGAGVFTGGLSGIQALEILVVKRINPCDASVLVTAAVLINAPDGKQAMFTGQGTAPYNGRRPPVLPGSARTA